MDKKLQDQNSADYEFERHYLAGMLEVSEEEIDKAIRQVGNNREDIEKYIRESKDKLE